MLAALAALIGLAVDRTRLARVLKAGITAPARFSTLLLIAAASLVLHLGLDLICDYPLRLLYPFSDRDFALYWFNYSHFAFTLGFAALALALLYPLARKAGPPKH